MSKLDYLNIEQVPAHCGGQPVVGGTRIRVDVILACYWQGMSVEEIVQQYPALKSAGCRIARPTGKLRGPMRLTL